MELTIGLNFAVPVASLNEASRIYCQQRDASGFGASRFPDGIVLTTGVKRVRIARISYNGRVWPPSGWQDGMKPLLEAQG